MQNTTSETYHQKSWPVLRTPLTAFLVTMLPINALMLCLLIGDTGPLMKISAATVTLITLVVGHNGYIRRLRITNQGARLSRLFGSIEIPWQNVRRIGTYVPGIGNSIEYVYVTTRDAPPEGKWDMQKDMIQVQNQPGLIEALEAARRSAAARLQN